MPRRALAVAAAGAVIVAGGYLGVHAGRGAPARRAETRLASGAAPAVSPTPSAPPPTTASPPPTIASPPPAVVAARPIAAAPVTDAMSAPAAAPATTLPPRRTAAERDSAALPTGPDAELAAGGWRPIDRAEAIAILGGRMGAIPGLRIESITTSEARGRSRVRLAQIARSGQRIVLIETAGSEVPSGGAARATAVSVMPPPDPSSESIGSASLGNLQITARSSLAPEALRSLLGRLGVLSQP